MHTPKVYKAEDFEIYYDGKRIQEMRHSPDFEHDALPPLRCAGQYRQCTKCHKRRSTIASYCQHCGDR